MKNEVEPDDRSRRSGALTRVDSPTIIESVPSSDRVAELDALRGVACLLIVVYHFKPDRVPGGWAGVDFFLILSGYLITNIILKYHDRPGFLRAFYIRRWLRICPLYYLTLAMIAIASPILPRLTDFSGFFQAATYTQNVQSYWSGRPVVFSQYLTHTWSLAIEEQFYLLWPPILYLVGRRGVVPAALVVVGISFWARANGFHWWLLIARSDGFALGAILAATLGDRACSVKIAIRMKLVLGVMLSTSTIFLIYLFSIGAISRLGAPKHPGSTILAIALFGFSIVGLAILYAGSPLTRPLRNKTLGYIGKISYGVYMYHLIIIMLGDDIAEKIGLRGKPFWREALEAAIFFGMAAVSYRYIERPILALKDRIPYGRAIRINRSENRGGVHGRSVSNTGRSAREIEREEIDR